MLFSFAPTTATPLAAHELLVFLLQVALLLLSALFFGRIAARAGLPAVVGELLVGVVLGPSVLRREGVVGEPAGPGEVPQGVGQLGIGDLRMGGG
ncbi:hypothetical protein ACWCQV_40180, partial [Streptomyces eurythermus]